MFSFFLFFCKKQKIFKLSHKRKGLRKEPWELINGEREVKKKKYSIVKLGIGDTW